jgi:hypothetical protein
MPTQNRTANSVRWLIFGYIAIFGLTTLIAIYWQAAVNNGKHKHIVFTQSELVWMMITSTAQFIAGVFYLIFKRD